MVASALAQGLRQELIHCLEEGSRLTSGTTLAELLTAWDFRRTVPAPPEQWTAGPSYWIHKRHPHIQGPIPVTGLVHPDISTAVLSMVDSVMAREAAATENDPKA